MSPFSEPRHIPVFRPGFGPEEVEAVRKVFQSGWIGPGPKVEEFEQRFAERVGARHSLAVSSCTAALHLSCLALKLGPGDEVLVPAITFVSCAHAVAHCGATPVFVEVGADSCLIDLADLEGKITPRTRAILVVHYGGNSAPMRQIAALASRYGLAVIEDAAHACGAWTADGPVGNNRWSDLCCFSFNSVKNLSTGDGGMITTRDSRLAEQMRRLRWLGIDRSTFERFRHNGNSSGWTYQWNYRVEETGFKYTMNDIAAAIGLVQLSKLDRHQERRVSQEQYYASHLADSMIVRPLEVARLGNSWHLYAVRTRARDELAAFLADRSIASSVHYAPLHRHPCYSKNQLQPRLPVSERLGETLLTLPLHHNLSLQEVTRVTATIREFEELRGVKKGGQGD